MSQSIIHIRGLRVYAYHGVLPQERVVGNTFSINVDLKVNVENAMKNDILDATVNYAEIIELIKKCMAEPSALLEHVVGRIVRAITEQFPLVEGGSVTLYKLQPPISAELDSVGFTYSW